MLAMQCRLPGKRVAFKHLAFEVECRHFFLEFRPRFIKALTEPFYRGKDTPPSPRRFFIAKHCR